MAQEKTQRFHFFLPIYYQKCIQMLLENGKMIFPVLKRPNCTHRSNPQLFNTSNLLSANLSRQNLSSPRLPKRFICSRITQNKIPDHPHSTTSRRFGFLFPYRKGSSRRRITNYCSSQRINPVPGYSTSFKVLFRGSSVAGSSPSENSITRIFKKAHYYKATSIQSH